MMEKQWICLLLLSAVVVNAQYGDDSYEIDWDHYGDLYDDIDNPFEDTKKSKEEFDQVEDNRLLDDAEVLDENEKDKVIPGESLLKEEEVNSEENADDRKLDSDEKPQDAIIDEIVNKMPEVDEANEKKLLGDGEENEDKLSDAAESKKENLQDDDDDENVNKLLEAAEPKDTEAEDKSDDTSKHDDDKSDFMDEQAVLPGMLPSSDEGKQLDKDEQDTKNEDILAETKQILEETDDNFDEASENDETDDNGDESDGNDDDNVKYVGEAAKDLIEEDTVDKVYKDLDEDLDKLMETWKKLNDGNEDYVEPEKNADDSINPDQIADYEEKYGVPYGEKYVLSLREQNYDEANGEEMSDEADDEEDGTNIEDKKIDQLVQDEVNDNDESSDSDTNNAENKNNQSEDEIKNDDDGLFKDDPKADDATSEEDDENIEAEIAKLLAHAEDAALDDGLPNDENDDRVNIRIANIDDAVIDEFNQVNDESHDEAVVPKSMLRDTVNSDAEKQTSAAPAVSSSDATVSETATTIDVSKLNSQQYDQLMEQFVKAHGDEFDMTKNDVGRNVAPIHITLTQEPTVITSPNHPRPYPTNNIIDWMFTGEGQGIELIINDFNVNGITGDYVLVKPGGIDATGTTGLVFSHMLNEPRRYRFLDVDKMFVRFEARSGLAIRPGFSFNVRMILPPSEDSELIDEALPDPEANAPFLVETFTVLIGGPTLPQFNESVEQFRRLIADMATMYINANDINPGLNTTLQVAQITNIAVCNLNWPNSDRCSEVTFSVPLAYAADDEDRKPRLTTGELRAMWYLYSTQDPFALRLRNLGMEEFTAPNDSGVLTVWLVIGFALLISMAMLAFALWRFSCFQNYSRMPAYSDRDSVYSEKQGLDLYPTPHQTLPPLFADNEYKWDDGNYEDSTRVDVGGFTNKSYAREELFDIDSDEEVVTPKQRDSGYQPRGFEV